MERTKEEIEARKMETGERLRKVRIASKLTEEQMAEAFKISVEEYIKFEEGIEELCVSHIDVLLRTCPLADLDYIFRGKSSADIYAEKALQTMPEEEYQRFIEKLIQFRDSGDDSDTKEMLNIFSDIVKFGKSHIHDKRLRDGKTFDFFTHVFEEGILMPFSE